MCSSDPPPFHSLFSASTAMKCVLLVALLQALVGVVSGSPVEQVVNLLQDLKTKIENDGKVEQRIYDKYACWCEKTSARKAASIEKAQEELKKLGQTILKLKGTAAVLSAEIAELEADIAKNKEEQAEATDLRQKENEAFEAETTEMKQAIAALEKAIKVLIEGSKSFLQESSKTHETVQDALNALPSKLSLKPEQMSVLMEFAKTGSDSKYAPQSWTVQGILKDMYDTFSTDLESATTTEAKKNRDFEAFIATKTVELQQMEKLKATKEETLAVVEERLAHAQAMYDDTKAQMEADIKFFDETKEACVSKHSEWTTRAAMRKEELEGITKAITILSSDEARELFSSTIKPGKETGMDSKYDSGINIESFLQLASKKQESPATKAYAKLRDQASKVHSFRLAALAVQVHEAKAGHFDKVIEAIDKMIATLNAENAGDIAKRDQCKDEYTKINSTISNVTWLIKNNEARIDKLTSLIELRTQEKKETIAQIFEVQKQMAAMTDIREQENEAFLNSKKDDTAAIKLLVEARQVLTAYYKNKTEGMGPIQGNVKDVFLQEPDVFFNVSKDQAPEAEFSTTGKRKNEAKGITQILTMIIEDLNDEIKNDMKAEEVAQLQYEEAMRAAEALKQALIDKKVNLETEIADLGQDKTDEEEKMKNNKAALKDEIDYKNKITPDCDWIIGAFYKRSKAREAELDGLKGAKEYLVGAVPDEPSFVEKAQAFDDGALAKIQFLSMGA